MFTRLIRAMHLKVFATGDSHQCSICQFFSNCRTRSVSLFLWGTLRESPVTWKWDLRGVCRRRRLIILLTVVLMTIVVAQISHRERPGGVRRVDWRNSSDGTSSFGQVWDDDGGRSPCEGWVPDRNVFLLETMREGMIPKVMCTVESITRHMPAFCVRLLIRSMQLSTRDTQFINALNTTVHNFQVSNLDGAEALRNSPLEGFLDTPRYRASHYPGPHLSDLARVALLYKYGGLYSDLDIIALKSLDRAPQYLARTPNGGISNGVMKLRRRSPLLTRYCADIWTSYDPSLYAGLFYMLGNTTRAHCLKYGASLRAIDKKDSIGLVERCGQELAVFGVDSGLFQPFGFQSARNAIFNESSGDLFARLQEQSDSALLHYAGYSRNHYLHPVDLRASSSLFARLFRQHCPTVSSIYRVV